MSVLRYKQDNTWKAVGLAEQAAHGTTDPTTSTIAAYVGMHYLNTASQVEWVCTAINGSTYTWAKVTGYPIPESGIPKTDLSSGVQASLDLADSAYQKDTQGIPASDLVAAVQTSLGKADSAYQKDAAGIPKADLVSAVQTSLGKADTAYQKDENGIPKTDLTSAVQASLDLADSAIQSHQSLSAYRTSADQDTIDATLQPKSDDTLTTTAKTVVGAVNENKSRIDTLTIEKQNTTDISLLTTDKSVVGAINEHETDIGTLFEDKANKSDIVDNLTTNDATKMLSAKQGKVLNEDKSDKLPRYKDITSYFTDGTLWNRISGTGYAHPYYDICVGDYLDMGATVTCPDSYDGTVGSRYVTVASLGGLRCNGDNNVVDFPHLVMIPGQGAGGSFHFGRHAMNDTHTTEGGYVGSKMHTDVLGPVVSSGSATGTINQQLYNIFGAHLKTTRELLTNSINASGYNRFGTNSGCSNNWGWVSCQACLMSEMEVYGGTICSSSLYDTGVSKRQFELFAMDEKTINNRSSYYWLKDIVSASCFADVSDGGDADCAGAGHAHFYVRPRFVIA